MRLYIVWTYSPSGDSGIRYVSDSLDDACAVRETILTPRTPERRFDVRITVVDTGVLFELAGELDEHVERLCEPGLTLA